MTPLVGFEDVRKRFHTVDVLHGVSFEVNAGRVLGLIGENGSGKSTCMNILGGVVPMTSGRMLLNGRNYAPESPRDAKDAGIAFVHQELNLFTNLSIEDNLFIDSFPRYSKWMPTIKRSDMRRRSQLLLDQIGLPQLTTTAVSRLSQGERQMVEIAKGLRSDAKLMIYDEPTTSLTKQECDRLFKIIERLRDQGLGIIYISHILDDVLRLADDIVVLRDGHVAATCLSAETSTKKLVQHMVGREIEQLYPSRSSIDPGSVAKPPVDPALRVAGLTKTGFVKDIELEIRPGEILGLAGLMGSGRTELARMIFGLDSFDDGTVQVGSQVLHELSPAICAKAGMAFVTEDRHVEGLLMDARIRANVRSASIHDFAQRTGLLALRKLDQAADQFTASSGLGHESPWGKFVRELSGGNQQKVVLAKWMMRRPSVLILDEPTRGIDIGAKHEIYESIARLADSGSAVLMISSEIEELMGLCDRIAILRRGEIAAEFGRHEFSHERLMQAAIWRAEISQ